MTSKNFITTGEISEQTRQMIKSAGNAVKEIKVKNPTQAQREIDYLASKINETAEWDDEVKAIERGMGLVAGGALLFDNFVKDLVKIGPGLATAAKNQRSSLVKASCLFITQLAHSLKSKFDVLGEIFIPLSSQTSTGTQIIADCCRYTMIEIAHSCPSRRVIGSILSLAQSRAINNRQICSESIGYILEEWPTNVLEPQIQRIEATIKKLLNDASDTTRSFSRTAAKALFQTFPSRQDSFMDSIDPRTRKAIEETPYTPAEQQLQITFHTESKEEKSPRRKSQSKLMQVTLKKKARAASVMPPPKAHITTTSFIPTAKRTSLPGKMQAGSLLQLENGKEMEFLDKVDEFVKTGKVTQLKREMEHIVPALIVCAIKQDPDISNKTLCLMHSLIPSFSSFFKPKLSSILEIFFNDLIISTPENNEMTENILKDIQLNYDPDELLEISSSQIQSKTVFNFVSIALPQVTKIDEKKCQSFLTLAASQAGGNENAAHRIVQTVANFDAQIVRDFRTEQEPMKSIVQKVLNEIKSNLEIPIFNPRNVPAWSKEVLDFSSKSDNFDEARESLYQEVADAVDQTNDGSKIFELMWSLLEKNGQESHIIFVNSALLHMSDYRIGEVRPFIKKVIGMVKSDVLMKEMIENLDGKSEEMTYRSIDLITQVISTGSRQHLDALFSKLGEHVKSEAVTVRKSTIFCLAKLKSVFPKETGAFAGKLTLSQQKLIDIYMTKKKK